VLKLNSGIAPLEWRALLQVKLRTRANDANDADDADDTHVAHDARDANDTKGRRRQSSTS
jgi:hypothetical protein